MIGRRTASALIALAVSLVAAGRLAAQAPGTVRALGLGDASVALATGYEAGLYNPAGLAVEVVDLTAFGLRAGLLLGPGGFRSLRGAGSHLDPAEKAALLEAVRRAGGASAALDAGVHLLGIAARGFALNVGTVGRARGAVPPALMELVLYGNVGQGGDADGFTFDGAGARGHVVTTVSLSHGRALPLGVPGEVSIGATARYGRVHAWADLRDEGSRILNDPVDARASGSVLEARGGSVYGLDLGLRWGRGEWAARLLVRDLFAGHRIDRDGAALRTLVGTASLEEGTHSTTIVQRYDELDAGLRAAADRRLAAPLTATRIVVGGARVRSTDALQAQLSFGSSRSGDPSFAFAAGGTLWPARFLELRGAARLGSDPAALFAGVSFQLAAAALDLGVQRTLGRGLGGQAGVQLRVSPGSGGR